MSCGVADVRYVGIHLRSCGRVDADLGGGDRGGSGGRADLAGAPGVSRRTAASSIWATSTTWTSSRAVPSAWAELRPSLSMTLQNGQPIAMRSAPVATASSVRLVLIRVPSFSSIHMRAPPAPQQNDFSPRAGHLAQLDPRQRAEQLARRRIHAVVPAEVARVVVRDGRCGRGGPLRRRVARSGHRHEPLLPDQPVEQLGVVDHLVGATDLRVLVLQRVEAVRTGDDDLRRAGLVEGLDVLLGQHLEQELVARAAGGVAGAALAVAEHRERHPGGMQQLGHRAGGPLRPVLQGAGAADPEQVVDLGQRLDVRAPTTGTSKGRSLAQSSRIRGAMPHGLAFFSRFLNSPFSSAGKADSMSTW